MTALEVDEAVLFWSTAKDLTERETIGTVWDEGRETGRIVFKDGSGGALFVFALSDLRDGDHVAAICASLRDQVRAVAAGG